MYTAIHIIRKILHYPNNHKTKIPMPDLLLHFLEKEFILPPFKTHWHNIESSATAILSNMTNDESNVFCEMATFYIRLRRQYPFCDITISKIGCQHKLYIHAFKLFYAVKLVGGEVLNIGSPPVVLTKSFRNYYYNNVNRRPRTDANDFTSSLQIPNSMPDFEHPLEQVEYSEEHLLPGEYIIGCYQAGAMERLIFTTNKRNIVFGQMARSFLDKLQSTNADNEREFQEAMPLKRLSRRIVAFGGSSYNYRRLRIAYFTESVNWMLIGHFILFRRLMELGRAEISSTDIESECVGEMSAFSLLAFEKIMRFIMEDASQEIFRMLLSFIGHDIEI